MTSRSIVLGTAAVLLMSAATPLQIGLSPTAAFAQEISLDAALAGNPAELNAGQLRERIQVLRDAVQDGTLTGDGRQAAQQKIRAYREVLQGIRAERQEAQQDNGQPAEGEGTQRQQQPDRNAEQRQAEREAEREAQREEQQRRKAEREAEREAQREEQQQRKAEREAQREAERRQEEQRQTEQRQAEQRQAEQRQAEQRQAEQRQAEQRQAEQREAEQREAEQQRQRQQQAQQDDGPALTREMTAALRDTRPASELDQAELHNRMQALRAAMQSGALPNDQRSSVQARIRADREVALARRAERLEDTTTEQPQQRDQRARSEDRPQEEVDRRAREIIADNRPASDLDSNVLRERLANNRELLGTEQLSRTERQQLREQLTEDREELRARVAARQEEQEEQEEARAPDRSGTDDRSRDSEDRSRGDRSRDDRSRGSDDRMSDRNVSRIIEERMPSSQLTERELEQRVRVLQRALNRGNITVREAEVARLLIERDREELRGRLFADRDRRRDRRRSGWHDDVFIEFEVGYRPPPVIYAAEAMPRDIRMQLVAPPLYQTQRAYTPQEIATNHDVREAMPGIEIDTLNFDFGSAEVRPEEIEKLDEIGMVIESVVAERPDEVFLIEGHTDAVGSDAANDALSQRRAQAVVEALLDYFIIEPENLQTVGLGERYLRINTPDPEEENRRVTVRRITPLLAGRG